MSHKRQIFKSSILKKLLTEKNSCVSLVQGTRLLALPPFFLNDMKSGILYQLNTLLKKYDRSLGGIVIGYQNIKVLMDENTGIIPIGTSEIEVNISVEFYIFQPKIGSCLEGVINKKSNTHIGCLVHKYFNATILKPEEVLYEDWICKNFNVDDRIIFKVKDLDFTTLLPYIEGDYDGAIKVSSEISENCDTDLNKSMESDLNKTCQNEVLLSKEFCKRVTNLNENSDKYLSDKKDVKKKEVTNKLSVNNKVDGNNSFSDFKVKKKKKKKKKEKALTQPVAVDHNETNTECQPSQDTEDDMFYSTQLEPSVPKKMRISFCSPIPSTAPFKPDKEMAIPETPVREPNCQDNPNGREKESKKKHKKRKKEKKEEADESPPSKKRKISTDSTPKHEEVNKVDEKNSLLESMMQQLCKQQLDRVREELNISSSDKESFKEEKKKKKKKEKKPPKEVKESNNEKSQINGNDDKFLEVKTIFEKLWKEKVEKVKEEFERKNFKESKKTKEKEKKQEKSKKKTNEESKKITNAQSNSTNGNAKKSEEQSLIDKIYRQEIDRAKAELNKSDTDNVKEKKESLVDKIYRQEIDRVKVELSKSDTDNVKEKKKKKSSSKQESRKEKPLNSLYDRLLNDARSAIEFSPNRSSKKKKKSSD